MCVHVKPAGTETELMLRNHVMPLPRPRGHASLCLSAFPTTPIMHLPPAVDTKDRTDAVYSGMGRRDKSKKGRKGGCLSKCDLSRLWLMGGWKSDGVLVGGRSNIWIILNLSKGKHLCGVWIPVEDIIMWCLLVMYCWNIFKPFNVQILIVWFQRVLTTVVLLLQGDSDNLTVLASELIKRHCFCSFFCSSCRL